MSIDIAVHTPPLNPTPLARHRSRPPGTPLAPRPPTRRQLVTALLATEPRRTCHGWELAKQLQVKPRNMLTQLAEWTRLGFITRTGAYALPNPTPGGPGEHRHAQPHKA